MSKFSNSILKLARENPEFRQALLEKMASETTSDQSSRTASHIDGPGFQFRARTKMSINVQWKGSGKTKFYQGPGSGSPSYSHAQVSGVMTFTLPSGQSQKVSCDIGIEGFTATSIRCSPKGLEYMALAAAQQLLDNDTIPIPTAGKTASTQLSARDVERLPVGSVVFMIEGGRPTMDLTVVPGGLAPVSILSERADGFVPEGEAIRGFGDQFLLAYRGKNKVLSRPAAKKHSMRAFREFGKTSSHKHLYGDDLVESLELMARLGPDWTPAQKRAAKEIAKAMAKGDKATVRRHMRALDTTSIYNEISNWVSFS